MHESEERVLLCENRGPVAVLTLNRPDKLNAFSNELPDELNALSNELIAALVTALDVVELDAGSARW